jgi:lipopolysaccharide/colanic/teichoic acid biosynthesis glycosyltransferase
MELNVPADAPAEPTPTPPWPTVDDIPPTTAVYLPAPADWYASLKPTFDTIVAAVGVVLLFPFIVLAWAAIKISSPGPGLYVQTRAGRGNRPFSIFKIRSMKHDLATAKNLNWATQGDARITWVGKLLRKLHLDELPQLFNVLRGEMSLVGPRPERPEVISLKGLPDEVPGYAFRALVRPGVTGLAQIQLPADTDITSVRHKVYYDLYYITHQSVWLDARICVGTVLKCFLRAETLRKILFLPTRERVCEHFLSLLAAPDADAEAVPVPVV